MSANLEVARLRIATPAAFGHASTRGRFDGRPRHIRYMDDRLLEAALVGGRRLIIEVPPRHGKSTLTSIYGTSWFLGTWPDKRVILVSHEADLAQRFSAASRDQLTAYGHWFPGAPRPWRGSRARGRWDLDGFEGGMLATGIGGSITGRGADLIVIDDWIKDAMQARSALWRERSWDWWQSTLRNRLEGGGSIVLLGTRWHEDDLAGRILEQSEEEWERVRLQAISTEREPCPMGRKPGEALWPERWPLGELQTIRREVGSYWFAAQFQQSPRPDEGNRFKRGSFRYWTRPSEGVYGLGGRMVPESLLRRFTTVDVAASTKTSADYTVISTWGFVRGTGELLLLDRVRERAMSPKQPAMLEAVNTLWSPAFIGVEHASFGITLMQNARLAGLPIRPLHPDGDKETRALAAQALYESGMVWHPAPAMPGYGWVTEEWEPELLGFPNWDHDDQVDTASYAAKAIQGWGSGGSSLPPPPDPEAKKRPIRYDMEH